MTLVSVIIPTRNCIATIERCLRSVQAQTYPDVEIIVVDNHSEDGTAEAAAGYAKVLTGGPERSAQVNFGAAHASGDFLYRIDGDFELDPKVIAACVEKAEKEKIDVLAVPNRSAGESFWGKVRELERNSYHDDPLIVAARFWRREAFEAVGGFDELLVACEDYDLHNRLLAAGYKFGRVEPGEVHLGEPTSLWAHGTKNFYYAPSVWRYLRKHPKRGSKQMFPLRPAFLRNWRALVRQPSLLAGLFLLKLVQYCATALGIFGHALGALDGQGHLEVNVLASMALVLASLRALIRGMPRFGIQLSLPGVILIYLAGLLLWQVVGKRRASKTEKHRPAVLPIVALAFTPFLLVWALENVVSPTLWLYSFSLAVAVSLALLLYLAQPDDGRANLLPSILVGFAVLCFVALFSLRAVRLHESLSLNAYDLALYDQALWTTIYGQDSAPLLNTSIYGGSLFVHTPAPALLLLLPFYMVGLGGPILLLIVQAAAIGLGAIALYRLSSKEIGPNSGALLALAYLIYFLTLRSTAVNFQIEAIAVPLLLFALDAFQQRRLPLYYFLIIATLACGVDASLAVAGLGLFYLSNKIHRRHGLITLALGVGWIWVLAAVFVPFFGGSAWAPFFPYAPPPDSSWPAHIWDSVIRPEARSYLGALLAPLAFAPLLGARLLAPALPRFILNLLGGNPIYIALSGRYAFTVIPFLFLAAARGLGKLSERHRHPLKLAGATLILIATVLTTSFLDADLVETLFRGPHPSTPERDDNILALIPDRAPVAAQSALAVRLAHREALYLLPVVNEAEYILFDIFHPNRDPGPALYDEAVRRAYNNPEYGLRTAENGYLLFQRGLDHTRNNERLAFASEAEIDHPVDALLDNTILYRGFSLSADTLEPDGPIVLTHYWQSIAPVDRPYLLFTAYPGAYLFEQAAYGFYPVSEWQPGDLVRHDQLLQLPELPDGADYEIVVGLWYDEGEPALRGPEQLLGSDVIRVATIIVQDGHYRIVPSTGKGSR